MRIRKAALTVAILSAGIACAAAVTAPSAQAWDITMLPSGYFVSNYTTVCHVATDPCVGGEGSTCNHYTIQSSAGNFAETDCVNPTFQSDLNHYIDSTICAVNPAAGGSACAPASTTAPPTTSETTTTGASGTSSTTTAASTTSDPSVTTGAATTVTVTTTVSDPTVDQRLTALEGNYAALAARVDAIAHANAAAWNAFSQSLAGGGSVADAALAARSAGLNAIYQL